MHRFIQLVVPVLLTAVILCGPVNAQDGMRPRIQQLLSEASRYYSEENYFVGVAKVTEACSMLKSNPGAMPETTYVALAGKSVDEVMTKIREAETRRDIPNTTRRIYALQPLLDSLIAWDPSNPRWHYEKGMMFRSLSKTMNDAYPQHLQSAASEFKQALAISGGGSYRASAQQMLSSLQQTLGRRKVEIGNFQRTHGKHNLNNQAKPADPSATTICGTCGREHPSGYRCPYCGH